MLEERDSTYRIFAFAEDLPGWESDEPVLMMLTPEERAHLLAQGVVRERG